MWYPPTKKYRRIMWKMNVRIFIHHIGYINHIRENCFAIFPSWSRSTMDSIRVSEALDSGSIPDETTKIE
jgi:hypothetical protein